MSYTPGIPAANDVPSSSQGQIATNFTQLNTIFDVDHITFDAATANGEHNRVTLNSAIADPNQADPKASLYLKTVAGNSELFFENFDVGAAANLVRQMSNLPLTTLGSARGITTPWGLIMNFGAVTINQAATPILFPIAYPTAALTLTLTVGNSATAAQQAVFSNLATTGFTGYGSTNGLFVYYFSIGN